MLTLTEITPWHDAEAIENILDTLRYEGVVGVVIKGTQGPSYVRDSFATVYDDAIAEGHLVAFLHYCTPGVGTAQDEAMNLLGALGARPAPLGIWLELDDTRGIEGYQLAEYVLELAGYINTPERPVTLLGSIPTLASLATLPSNIRRVYTTRPGELDAKPWAYRDELATDSYGDLDGYSYVLQHPRSITPAMFAKDLVPKPIETVIEAVEAPEDDLEETEENIAPSWTVESEGR